MDPLSWIAHMRGPEFLVLYAIYCAVVATLAFAWSRHCDPLPYGAQLPSEPRAGSDPYELAWLRAGAAGILQTALVSLNQQQFVQVIGGQVQRTTLVPHGLRQAPFSPAEPRRSALRPEIVAAG